VELVKENKKSINSALEKQSITPCSSAFTIGTAAELDRYTGLIKL
jgi:hypothetical protein